MNSRVGTVTSVAYPAMRELLRQCLAESHADVAFVALLDIEAAGPLVSLDIPAVFPPLERSPRTLTHWVKMGVLQAIKAGRTETKVARTTASGGRRAGSKVLTVAPMYSDAGVAWGAVAVIRATALIDWESVNPVQQCARAISTVLTESDDPYSSVGFTTSTAPLPRQRVNSGPREDFLLHELRVPLSAATYALEALVQRHGPNWDYDDEYLLHTAQSGIEEAQRIVRSVSQWPALGNGISKPHLAAVALDEMLARAITLLPTARHKVVRNMDPDFPLVYGDESWITQVFVNLLENALKYSNSRRHIEVTTYQSDRDFAVVRVRSWGNALPTRGGYYPRADEHDRPSGEPTSKGLGLNIARYFVTSLGGELRIEGEGTREFTVTVALPILTAANGKHA